MADLVNTYESLPLGTTDASVVAVAERRPEHADALTLLP